MRNGPQGGEVKNPFALEILWRTHVIQINLNYYWLNNSVEFLNECVY